MLRLEFGYWIKSERDWRKWSLRELARRTGLSAAYLGRMENNQHPNPSMDVVRRLADAFEVSVPVVLLMAGYIENISDIELEPAELPPAVVDELGRIWSILSGEDKDSLISYWRNLARMRIALAHVDPKELDARRTLLEGGREGSDR